MNWFERLSSVDSMFLDIEDPSAHIHVGSVGIYEGRAPDYEKWISLIASRLDRVPRYRQRVEFVPLRLSRPVWVDEPNLDLHYNARHMVLPSPGGDAALNRFAAQVFARPLDRRRPLWEMWLVEGLEPNRFAIVSKVHHCMLDGIAGVDLTMALHDFTPEVPPVAQETHWTPRPAPAPTALAAASLRDQLAWPLQLARGALRSSSPERRILLETVAGMKPFFDIVRMGPAPWSSLNHPLHAGRRWEVASLDLAAVKRVKSALGATVNDVVLTVVGGAMRRLLEGRGERHWRDLRAFVPVNVRPPEARGQSKTFGNAVSMVFCPLGTSEADPVHRLRKICKAMSRIKETRQALGGRMVANVGDLILPTVAREAARFFVMAHWFNVVITNIPGPQFPLYLAGRKLLSWYPTIPLAKWQTIGISVASYNGKIEIGLLGDADRASDLPVLARAIPDAFAELEALAGEVPRPHPAAAAS